MGQFCRNYLKSDDVKTFVKEMNDKFKGRLELNPSDLFGFNDFRFVILPLPKTQG
jgi:hypothetical protein